jgi:midasin
MDWRVCGVSQVWSRCEALVTGLAADLTEQLRLILEPTLASKLAGDFRTGGLEGRLQCCTSRRLASREHALLAAPTTLDVNMAPARAGKRINMRKVIGYIASHFRRDKIWLRRSRPDKRRYQVRTLHRN